MFYRIRETIGRGLAFDHEGSFADLQAARDEAAKYPHARVVAFVVMGWRGAVETDLSGEPL